MPQINNSWVKGDPWIIKREIRKYLELNENENIKICEMPLQ